MMDDTFLDTRFRTQRYIDAVFSHVGAQDPNNEALSAWTLNPRYQR